MIDLPTINHVLLDFLNEMIADTEFPPETISSPTEFVLLEGCRLLDERAA
jgi:hypothetical protein